MLYALSFASNKKYIKFLAMDAFKLQDVCSFQTNRKEQVIQMTVTFMFKDSILWLLNF